MRKRASKLRVVCLVKRWVGGKCAGEDCHGASADERTMVWDSGVDAGEGLGMVGESEGEGERESREMVQEKEGEIMCLPILFN